MATTIRVDADLIRIVDELSPSASSSAATMTGLWKRALIRFAFPSNLQYKRITKIQISLYSTKGANNYSYISEVHALLGAFSSGVTYDSAPSRGGAGFLVDGGQATGYASTDLPENDAHNILTNGVWIQPGLAAYVNPEGILSTSLTTNPPYLTVTYDDTAVYGKISGNPQSGYIPKSGASTVRWAYESPGNIAGVYTVSGYRVGYKKAQNDSYAYVDAGTALSYTFPAGTFSDTVNVWWYPEATLNNGQKLFPSTSYLLSTVEPLFTCVPLSPVGTIEDGSAPITFTWDASNSVGTLPKSCDLNYSTDDGSTWTWFGTSSTGETSFTTAANALPAGELMWRVRGITNDNRAGYWSASVSFINAAAPAAPSVSSDAAPFATISWDADGQQAYEVSVDGISYGVMFGTAKQFTLKTPLSDGNHTAAVRVQGAYGLWSAFGSVDFVVSNSASGTITLSLLLDTDAVLSWDASPAGSSYSIYRDGVLIGKTTQSTFVDRMTVGSHTWYVLARQSDNNYTKSNEASGTLSLSGSMIAPFSGGSWISLKLMENSLGEHSFSYSKSHTLRHFSGSPWPVLELSPYEDFSETVRCAFASEADAMAFEALRGQVVILKSADSVVIGGLMTVQKVRNTFYRSYQFTIERIAAEEIVDDPNS